MENVLRRLNIKMNVGNKRAKIVREYLRLPTDELRVIIIFHIMLDYDVVPEILGAEKNVKSSKIIRELGNIIFVHSFMNIEKCVEAFNIYTQSIAFAPSASQELALAYANRSAVLLKLRKYVECIEDIERALNLNYPENLKGKLHVRKVKCLVALGSTDVTDCYDTALNCIEKLTIDDTNREKLKSQLNAIPKTSEKLDTQKTTNAQSRKQFLPVISSYNTEIPCASDAISIKYNAQYGRHVVATRDINPGEVLSMETPYSSLLTPDNIRTHCFKCLEVSWANIPCDHCTFAMYCSEACKAADWAQSHDIECSVFPHLIAMGMTKIDLLSLRLAIQAVRESTGWEELEAQLSKVDECDDPRTKGFSEDGIFYSGKYQSLYSCDTNIEHGYGEDIFRKSLDTCFILYYVGIQTEMFGSKLSGGIKAMMKNDFVTFFGGLILRHQRLLLTNHQIIDEVRGMATTERAIAAMPFFSLFNHSCDPQIYWQSRSNLNIAYALYPIKKGEQIFDSYGMIYALHSRAERQISLLTRYDYQCNCTPCVEDWPDYYNLKSYKDLSKKPKNKKRIKKALEKFDVYCKLAESLAVLDEPYVMRDLLMMVEVLYKYAPLPCAEMRNVLELVKRVYALSGNRFDMPQIS